MEKKIDAKNHSIKGAGIS